MAAPKVWAAVFRIRITAIGFSISSLKRRQMLPIRGRFSAIRAILLGVMLSSAASMTEQRNETDIATAMLTIRRVI